MNLQQRIEKLKAQQAREAAEINQKIAELQQAIVTAQRELEQWVRSGATRLANLQGQIDALTELLLEDKKEVKVQEDETGPVLEH